MGTILITGGAGFIGSNLVRLALAETTASVVIVDKLTYAGSLKNLDDVLRNPRVTFSRTDIAEQTAVAELFRTYRPPSRGELRRGDPRGPLH